MARMWHIWPIGHEFDSPDLGDTRLRKTITEIKLAYWQPQTTTIRSYDNEKVISWPMSRFTNFTVCKCSHVISSPYSQYALSCAWSIPPLTVGRYSQAAFLHTTGLRQVNKLCLWSYLVGFQLLPVIDKTWIIFTSWV